MQSVEGSRVRSARSKSSAAELEKAAQLRAVLIKLGRRLRSIGAVSDLTPAEQSALGAVVRRGSVRASELATIEGLNPTMVSRVLGRLEHDGWVRRLEDEEDRRVVKVESTAAGRRFHERLRTERAMVLVELLDELPDAKRRAVLHALPALEELADAIGRPRA
jgi:DNA-binding MarR family transcriptional regulator